MQVLYKQKQYDFPAEALGGLPTAPLFKATDELLLRWLGERPEAERVAVMHDHFGVLSTVLSDGRQVLPFSDNIIHHRRRERAFAVNGIPNNYVPAPHPVGLPLSIAAPDCGLMNVPKLPGLFKWYLHHVSRLVGPGFTLATAFYTRHFTPQLLEIAGEYAEGVTQTRAHKKARLLVLSKWKRAKDELPIPSSWGYDGLGYLQYPGVFSAKHIDYATQFLLDTWRDTDRLAGSTPNTILDIGCGNGIIGETLTRNYYPTAVVHGTDVSFVAIKSARSNNQAATYHWQHDLSGFNDHQFDLIVTNPPFHDGHRNVIEPTLQLFREAARTLSRGGRFVVVANRHLNYASHLRRLFAAVTEVAANKKYVIYSSTSGS